LRIAEGRVADPIRVLIVDDHPLLRDGIAVLIANCDDIVVVGQAEAGKEAIDAHRKLRPDVTLMDLQLPDMDGVDVIRAIKAESPQARLIVLTTYSGDTRAQQALKAGARAYTLKNHARRDLLDTIRRVFAGHKFVDPEVAGQIAEHSGEESLTPREIEVLTLIAGGRSNKWIANELAISEDTVKGHVSSILAKLNANDRTHAVTLAIKRGAIHI
jgi:DNA-binding NarL/FixJ family response regulator